MERNHFNNFGRGSLKEHFCEIENRPLAKEEMLFKGFFLFFFFFFFFFSFGSHFVQRSGIILAILVEGHLRNIFMKLF